MARKALSVLCAASALATAGAAAAPATAAPRHSLAGDCQIAGTASGYTPALSVLPASRSFTFTATGLCTGTLDGVALPPGGTPVQATIAGKTTVDGCPYGITLRAPGVLRTLGPTPISVPFQIDVYIAGTLVLATVTGDNGGLGFATGTIQPNAATLAGCAAGTLETLDFQTDLRTLTPFISN